MTGTQEKVLVPMGADVWPWLKGLENAHVRLSHDLSNMFGAQVSGVLHGVEVVGVPDGVLVTWGPMLLEELRATFDEAPEDGKRGLEGRTYVIDAVMRQGHAEIGVRRLARMGGEMERWLRTVHEVSLLRTPDGDDVLPVVVPRRIKGWTGALVSVPLPGAWVAAWAWPDNLMQWTERRGLALTEDRRELAVVMAATLAVLGGAALSLSMRSRAPAGAAAWEVFTAVRALDRARHSIESLPAVGLGVMAPANRLV